MLSSAERGNLDEVSLILVSDLDSFPASPAVTNQCRVNSLGLVFSALGEYGETVYFRSNNYYYFTSPGCLVILA